MEFRGVWTPNSCFPRRGTPGKRVFRDLDSHSFSVDEWIFEVFESRIHVPHVELPLVPSLRLTLSIRPGNVLLTRLQTNTQSFIQ